MAAIADRLAELGIQLPAPAAAVGSYLPAVRAGDFVYTSGQLPVVDGQLVATGKVGADISPEQAADLARQCAINALAAMNAVADLDDVVRIVKVVGFVNSDPAFTGQPAVINGASNLLADVFGEAGVHARSAVGAASLPLGAPVEVELIAQLRS